MHIDFGLRMRHLLEDMHNCQIWNQMQGSAFVTLNSHAASSLNNYFSSTDCSVQILLDLKMFVEDWHWLVLTVMNIHISYIALCKFHHYPFATPHSMTWAEFKFDIEHVACCTSAVSVDTEQKISLAAAVSQGGRNLNRVWWKWQKVHKCSKSRERDILPVCHYVYLELSKKKESEYFAPEIIYLSIPTL